jgi:Zn-dependent peptidase ImmA (M78 family)
MATSTLAQLRDVIPNRSLSSGEAERIAELQATKLLLISGIREPAVPESVVSELPRLQIERIAMPYSGSSTWIGRRWVIEINENEAYVRNRWTLAHELKHILDHPYIDRLYPALVRQTSAQRAERAADYFAACLLIPRPMLKRVWGQGLQEVRALADLFEVSGQAMSYRLRQVGLTEVTARHRPYRRAPMLEAA